METPNPENLTVASSSFYLDPTHTRPIPPGLLSFLPKYYGFGRHLVLRLQEPPALKNKLSPSLIDVLEGVSPDYAVIAQKSADDRVLGLFDVAFSLDLGLTINTLSERYDLATQRSIMQSRDALSQLKDELDEQSSKSLESFSQLQYSIEQIQSEIVWLKSEVDSIYNSRSWKLTRPLRAIGNGLRRIKERVTRNE